MVKSLEAALADLGIKLVAVSEAGLDASGYNLHKSLANCKQWASNMKVYLTGARKRLLSLSSVELKKQADTLEGVVPR